MPEVGTGTVPILPDFSRFGKELERGVKPAVDAAGKNMEATFASSARRSAASVDDAFARTRVDIPITADTDRFDADLRRGIDPALDPVDIDVAANTAGFSDDLRRGVDPALRPVDIDVSADTSSFGNLPDEIRPHVDQAGDEMERSFGASAKRAAGAVVGAIGFALVTEVGRKLLDLGKETAVFQQKTKTVFQEATGDVERWAKATAGALGLTAARTAGLAANFGDLLKPMGFTSAQAAEMSTKVIELSGALSAWSGSQKSASEVADILSAAMLGERDALQGLGIAISADEVKSRLLTKSQQDLTGAALQQAEAIATQELIFEKSTDAQKAWADGSFDALKKQNELKAKVSELVETIAVGLLPVFTGAAELLTSLDPNILKVAAGFAAVGVSIFALSKAVAAIKAVTAAAGALNFGLGVLTASAVGVGVPLLALAAAAAGIYAIGEAASKTKVDLEKLSTTTNEDLVGSFQELLDLDVVTGLGDADKFFDNLLGKSISEAQRLVKALDAAGEETGKYQKAIDGAIAAEKAVVEVKEKDAKITETLGDATGKTTEAIEAEKRALEELTDKVNDAFGASQNLIGATVGVEEAAASLASGAADAATKERELAEAIRDHGRGSTEAKAAGEALAAARRAQISDADSLAQANVRLAEQQAIAAGRTLSDSEKYRLYRDELIKVKDTLAPGSELRKNIEGFINSLPPPEVKAKVVIEVSEAAAALARLQTQFTGGWGKATPLGRTIPMPERHDGGMVPGRGYEVPIMAQPGEFVLQKSAVASIGTPALEALNRFHTGGMVGGAQVLDRIARVAEPMTTGPMRATAAPASTPAGGSTVNVGGIVLNGVRDGEDALTRLPTRMTAALYLAGG